MWMLQTKYSGKGEMTVSKGYPQVKKKMFINLFYLNVSMKQNDDEIIFERSTILCS